MASLSKCVWDLVCLWCEDKDALNSSIRIQGMASVCLGLLTSVLNVWMNKDRKGSNTGVLYIHTTAQTLMLLYVCP